MNMTNQEAFDFVAKKLIEQGEPSINDSGMCLYRGPNNNRCAVGWLIPDDKYTEDMEGNTIDCDSNTTLRESINCNDLHFVSVLQTAHDNSTRAVENIELLDGMAEEDFGITSENKADAHEIIKEFVNFSDGPGWGRSDAHGGWRQAWKHRMYVIAGRFKLDYAVLETKWDTL